MVVKMFGKRVDNIGEKRPYIKVRTKIDRSVKQIYTELVEVYGTDRVTDKSMSQFVGGEMNFGLPQSPPGMQQILSNLGM